MTQKEWMRALVGLSMVTGAWGCSSTAPAKGVDSGAGGVSSMGGTGGGASGGAGAPDASPLGQSYACTGGGALSPDASPTPPLECVVGHSYCMVQLLDKVVGASPVYRCATLTDDGGLGVCSTTPTCDCLCGQGVICYTECSCNDTGGFVTVTCHQV